jgi:hypothetical protein
MTSFRIKYFYILYYLKINLQIIFIIKTHISNLNLIFSDWDSNSATTFTGLYYLIT